MNPSSTPEPVRVLIVDDEQEACANLLYMLRDIAGSAIEICGMACNTREAEALIRQHRPDLVFLDIDMPQENAFEFLERIAPFSFEVVFVTAYDEYAIRALKMNAADYILKPVDTEELRTSFEKVRDRISLKKIFLDSVPSGQSDPKAGSNKIILKDQHFMEIVDCGNIILIEARGKCAKIYFLKDKAEKNLTLCHSIADYEGQLPQDRFFRTHKSFLINCAHIKHITKGVNSSVTLTNDHKAPVGRRRHTELMEFLAKHTLA